MIYIYIDNVKKMNFSKKKKRERQILGIEIIYIYDLPVIMIYHVITDVEAESCMLDLVYFVLERNLINIHT